MCQSQRELSCDDQTGDFSGCSSGLVAKEIESDSDDLLKLS